MDWNELKEYAESNKIELQQISNELKMTPNGFRESIRNETIQLKKLKLLCEILKISLNDFSDFKKNGIYMSNIHFQAGDNNKINLESKENEIKLLKERLKDKEEIIQMLRDKINSIHDAPMLAASGKTDYKLSKK